MRKRETNRGKGYKEGGRARKKNEGERECIMGDN